MINENENNAENEKQFTQIRHRPGPKREHKYSEYKMSQHNDGYMY